MTSIHKYNKNKINILDLRWYFNKTTDLVVAEIKVYIHHTLVEIGAKNCHPKPITNLVWKTSLISLHEAEGNNRAKRIKLAHNRPAADHQTAQAQTTAHVLWVLQAAVNGALSTCGRPCQIWTSAALVTTVTSSQIWGQLPAWCGRYPGSQIRRGQSCWDT